MKKLLSIFAFSTRLLLNISVQAQKQTKYRNRGWPTMAMEPTPILHCMPIIPIPMQYELATIIT